MRSGRLSADERAIEGLPIRLVIALVVGVASLSVMMGMIDDVNPTNVSELDARPEPEVVEPGETDVTVTVVDPAGDPVADATVVAKSGTARLDGVRTARTGPNGSVEFTLSSTLGPNQDEGTIVFDVKPPAGSEYQDERENTQVLVVDG